MADHGKELLTEDLVLRSTGTGYLKFPQEFRQRYPFDKNEVPTPVAYLEEHDDRVVLRYEWETEGLPQEHEESDDD